MSISTTLSSEISHAKLFLLVSCGTLGRCSQNPWVENHWSMSRCVCFALHLCMCLFVCLCISAEDSLVAGASCWQSKTHKAYGISMSLYDQHPITGKISGVLISFSLFIFSFYSFCSSVLDNFDSCPSSPGRRKMILLM